MYIEHQFISTTQAAESYHRLRYRGRYLDDSLFKTVLDQLYQAIPPVPVPAFVSALKTRLKYLNEWALRRRLKDLIGRQGEIAPAVLPGPRGFVDSVVDTRNYLTHLDPELLPKARTSAIELFEFTQRLRVVLESALLAEIGFDSDRIRALIRRSRAYRYLTEVSMS
jgi:hypothetical protein